MGTAQKDRSAEKTTLKWLWIDCRNLTIVNKMRDGLKNMDGNRQRFIATFERFGVKTGWKGAKIKTYLFVGILSQRGQPVCDHIWMSKMLQLELLDLQPGDKISFDARVKRYVKGYKGRREYDDDSFTAKPIEVDYKLSHPNNIVKSVTGLQTQLF